MPPSMTRNLPAGYEVRRATTAHVVHVGRGLRPADRAELEALEGRPAGEVLADIVAHGSHALTIRTEPVLLYGIADCVGLPGHAMPWLAMTSTIAHDDLMNIMWMSRFQIDLWQRRAPKLQAMCDARNAFRRDWLEWLGFRPNGLRSAFGVARRPFDLYERVRMESGQDKGSAAL